MRERGGQKKTSFVLSPLCTHACAIARARERGSNEDAKDGGKEEEEEGEGGDFVDMVTKRDVMHD